MSAAIFVLGLTAASIALAFGLTRLSAAIRRIRQDRATLPIRDAAFFAQARAELADRAYAVSMLDQQDMGEGWS